jgi:hypothetical protein
MGDNLDIQEVSIHSDDAQSLIKLLDQELSAEYAVEHRHPVDFEPFHREGGVVVEVAFGQF